MLDDDEKHPPPSPPSPSSTPPPINDPLPQSVRLSPFYSVSARLKHFFPLTKSYSASGVLSSSSSPSIPPTIVTTSPTTPTIPSVRNDPRPPTTERLSSSSMENNGNSSRSSASSGRTSSTSAIANASQTHFHVVASSTVAAAIGSNHIHFVDDTISARSSDERSSVLNLRTSTSPTAVLSSNDTPATTSTSTPAATETSQSNTEKFFSKILPVQFVRLSHRQRRKNHSVSSIPDQQPSPMTRSAPASPKLLPQSVELLSTRSPNEDRHTSKLLSRPLPGVISYESLPATNRPVLGISTSSSGFPSPQRSPVRGRSSTVSSVSSDIPSRMSHSRTRRTNTIFSNLKGRDSGRGTPVEKLSLDNDEEEGYALPPIESNSGEEYFTKLQEGEGGLARCMRKLVESQYLQFDIVLTVVNPFIYLHYRHISKRFHSMDFLLTWQCDISCFIYHFQKNKAQYIVSSNFSRNDILLVIHHYGIHMIRFW